MMIKMATNLICKFDCTACGVFTILFIIHKFTLQSSVHCIQHNHVYTVVLFLAGSALATLLVRFYACKWNYVWSGDCPISSCYRFCVMLFHIYIVGLGLRWLWKHNPLNKHKRKQVERSLIMTTATLFKAAESKSQCTQRYGAVVY